MKRVWALTLALALCLSCLQPVFAQGLRLRTGVNDSGYRVVYDGDGADGTEPEDPAIYGDKNSKVTIQGGDGLSKTGYQFYGWETDDKDTYTAGQQPTIAQLLGETPDMGIRGITSILLKARWDANSYTVEFHKNAADAQGSMESQLMIYDKQERLRENTYTREGYVFQGWATAANGEKAYMDKAFVKNLTDVDNAAYPLYAVWQEESTSKQTIEIDQTVKVVTYDGNPHAFEVRVTSPAGASITGFAVEYAPDGTSAWSATSPTNAGKYRVRITRPADGQYEAFHAELPVGVEIKRAQLSGTPPTVSRPLYVGESLSGLALSQEAVSFSGGSVAGRYTWKEPNKSYDRVQSNVRELAVFIPDSGQGNFQPLEVEVPFSVAQRPEVKALAIVGADTIRLGDGGGSAAFRAVPLGLGDLSGATDFEWESSNPVDYPVNPTSGVDVNVSVQPDKAGAFTLTAAYQADPAIKDDIEITAVKDSQITLASEPALQVDSALSLVVGETGRTAVEAGNANGALSYEWYRDGVLLPDQTGPACEINTDAAGDFSYQVKVVNTFTDRGRTSSYTQVSGIIPVTVNLPVNAATPVFTQDLSAGPVNYETNSPAAALAVTASVSDGGTLSYQWYQSEAADGTGAVRIQGATTPSYTPSTQYAGTFYYYVIATNTNNAATGNKTAAARSNVAQIVVKAPVVPIVNAEKPVFDLDLDTEEVVYQQNDPAEPLRVEASVSDGGVITYQWYQAENASGGGASLLSGETNAAYTPSTARAGTFYYYVVALNTNQNATGNKTAFEQSRIAKITVQGGGSGGTQNAAIPEFVKNLPPIVAEYAQNQTADAFRVQAQVTDGGHITYQWYSNVENLTTGGALIPGAEEPVYTPSTQAAGTTYYYVIATNTNLDATGEQTAAATSSTLCVVVRKSEGGTDPGEIPVEGIALDKTELVLGVGDKTAINATVIPSDATNQKVGWVSSAPAIAFVDAVGRVQARMVGTAVITATTKAGGHTAECRVTVQQTPPDVAVKSVTLSASTLELEVGASANVSATVLPAEAKDKTVTWSSNDGTVATVDAAGRITAKAVGSAAITARTNDGGKTASCVVTVKKASSSNGGSSGGGSWGGSSTGSGRSYAEIVKGNSANTAIGGMKILNPFLAAANAKKTVRAAIEAAEKRGQGEIYVPIKLKNVLSISTDAAKAILNATKTTALSMGTDVTAVPVIYADTLDKNGKVQARIYLDPAEVVKTGKTLNLRAVVGDKSTEAFIRRYFSNKRLTVIHLEQKGTFGMKVEMAVRADLTGYNTENLHFYCYDREKNHITAISDPQYFIDANGFLHFQTELAGELLITDQRLHRL